jgi:hypothetical protein
MEPINLRILPIYPELDPACLFRVRKLIRHDLILF